MRDEDIELHDMLYRFITDAIPILEKAYEIRALPRKRIYIPNLEGNGLVKADFPDWSQISYHLPREVLELPSLRAANDICNTHSQIQSQQGKMVSAFQEGHGFGTINLPHKFLAELICCEEGLRFNIDIYDNIFKKFLNYIYPDKLSYAHVIVPLNNIIMKTALSRNQVISIFLH